MPGNPARSRSRSGLQPAPSALDRLALFMHGMLGDWAIPPDSDDEYRQQVTAYERRERTDVRGIVRTEWHAKREDHDADGEQMQIDCAAATRCSRLSCRWQPPSRPSHEEAWVREHVAEVLAGAYAGTLRPQQFLNFFPLPQGQRASGLVARAASRARRRSMISAGARPARSISVMVSIAGPTWRKKRL